MINYEEIKSEYLGTDITLRELGIKYKTSPTSSSKYKVKDSLTISNYLYQGSSISLDRKYTHYLQKIAV